MNWKFEYEMPWCRECGGYRMPHVHQRPSPPPGDPFGFGYATNGANQPRPPTPPPVPGPLQVLGLPADAAAADIKRRYRALMKEHHPDVGGAEATAKEITAAYAELEKAGRV